MNSPDSQSREKEIRAIRESSMFDREYYSKQCEKDLKNGESLEEHYLNRGEKQGLLPSDGFDPKFYAETNPDVKAAGINCLFHYVRYGYLELRYPNLARLKSDARFVSKSNAFNQNYFKTHCDHPGLYEYRPVEQYLLLWRHGIRPNDRFDDRFYYEFYRDVRKGGLSPLVHFIKIGQAQARICNQLQLIDLRNAVASEFDEAYYRRSLADRNIKDKDIPDLLDHYLSFGCLNGLNPNKNFDQQYYIQSNPDLVNAKVDPFEHFIKYGRREGRKSTCPIEELIEFGQADFDHDKETILIACHEASKTGAPLLGLGLVKALSSNYNIVSCLGRSGPIHEDFNKYSYKMIVGRHRRTDLKYLIKKIASEENLVCCMANSIESGDYVLASALAGVPSIALVHEFAEYTYPSGRMSRVVQAADRVVVPARLVADSIQKELQTLCGAESPNVSILPQGLLHKDKADTNSGMSRDEIRRYVAEKCPGRNKIVLGAGFISMRKGVDLFIETAAAINKTRNDVCFIWVGDGYKPKSDSQYSVWLQEMVERMGLQECVQFIAPQPDLDALMDVADVFFLSSRLDPFPNVFIDAVSCGLPVVCFEKATGSAEYINSEGFRGHAVEYCDIVAASRAVSSILDAPSDRSVNDKLAQNVFSFEAYVEAIIKFIGDAKSSNSRILNEITEIKESGFFNHSFYTATPTGRLEVDDAINDYARSSAKGITSINPLPGFSENLFLNDNEKTASASLLRDIRAGRDGKKVPRTHKYFEVGQKNVIKHDLRALLHVHLHYRQMLPEIINRLKASGKNIDLFVTVTSSDLRKEAEYQLIEWPKSSQVIVVPNQGRDLGPFLVHALPEALNKNYDIVGHIHGKKSLDVSEAFGSTWRGFLFDSLLGSENAIVEEILSIFYQEKNLGLIFAEDRFNVGWGENRIFAEKVLAKIQAPIKLPAHPMFPTGSMFWARPKALEPLATAYTSIEEFPIEPLPYDGSILHAIERMLPTICKYQGFEWATVFNPDAKR